MERYVKMREIWLTHSETETQGQNYEADSKITSFWQHR